MLRFLLLISIVIRSQCIWPPPYSIKLNQEETFVISELSENDDLYDDEMIKAQPEQNDDKYFRIHQLAIRYNKREWRESNETDNSKKIKELNFDLEDYTPWEGGFVDKNGKFIQPENERVYYLNEMAKALIESKIDEKREDESEKSTEEIENYDYNSMKSEYEKEVNKAEEDNATINFTQTRNEESVGEALEAVVEFKEAKNCTAEEKTGIGLAALECAFHDFKTNRTAQAAKLLFKKIGIICAMWVSVYLVIAIPCWCQRGWCCCCCRCKACKTRECIEEAKQFYAQNPPGILHSNGRKREFEPTIYEVYAQERMERAILNL